MEYIDILNVLAPCGLNCYRCFTYFDGEITHHSRELQGLLGDFDKYAKRLSAFFPAFKNYPAFKEPLAFLTKGDCQACRKGDCKYPNCVVHICHRQKGIDFCFQCGDFPCDKTKFDPDLKRRWIEMSNRMKEIGAEAYF